MIEVVSAHHQNTFSIICNTGTNIKGTCINNLLVYVNVKICKSFFFVHLIENYRNLLK